MGIINLLVIEDDPGAVGSYMDTFKNRVPCTPVYTASGIMGRALLFSNDITWHAAIIDIGTEDLDGMTILKELREKEAKEGRTPVAVFIATGYNTDSTQKEAEALGATFLGKPFLEEDLVPKLKQIANR